VKTLRGNHTSGDIRKTRGAIPMKSFYKIPISQIAVHVRLKLELTFSSSGLFDVLGKKMQCYQIRNLLIRNNF